MEYANIPYVDKPVSRIFFGTAQPLFLEGGDGDELLDAMYELGITAFDTARNYNLSERALGRWIARRGLREKVVILSKCGHPDAFWNKRVNEREMRKDFRESVRFLQTDYIDIYLLHRDDPEVDAGEVVEIFNALHAEGKIGAFGGSNWTHTRIAQANEYAYKHNLIPFTVSSPHFSLARQARDLWGGGSVSLTGRENGEARKWYESTQMPVVSYSSLSRGFFSGKVKGDEPQNARRVLDDFAMKGYDCPDNYERLRRCERLAAEKGCTVSQIALAWVFCQRINTFTIIGTSDPQRMKDNIAAMSLPLSEAQQRYLNLEDEKDPQMAERLSHCSRE